MITPSRIDNYHYPILFIPTHGGLLKWWVTKTIGFNTKMVYNYIYIYYNDSGVGDTPHFRKPPYVEPSKQVKVETRFLTIYATGRNHEPWLSWSETQTLDQ